jgi:H+/Cl- antiporter ClcA
MVTTGGRTRELQIQSRRSPSESFLEGSAHLHQCGASPELCVCGAVAGTGWWALYRFGSPLVSIRKAVEDRNSCMPFFTTVGHDLLQIVTVGLGSHLGREVAPREIGAMLAGRLSDRAGLAPEFRRVMVARGAGAGLAAVCSRFARERPLDSIAGGQGQRQ